MAMYQRPHTHQGEEYAHLLVWRIERGICHMSEIALAVIACALVLWLLWHAVK